MVHSFLLGWAPSTQAAGRSAMYLLTSLINKTDTVNETEYIAHGDAPFRLNEVYCTYCEGKMLPDQDMQTESFCAKQVKYLLFWLSGGRYENSGRKEKKSRNYSSRDSGNGVRSNTRRRRREYYFSNLRECLFSRHRLHGEIRRL